jgi:hypothetical protein
MMRRVRSCLLTIVSVTLIAVSGCGTSGSNPVLYHEVRFQVEPAAAGQATFSVVALDADGVPFGFPDGTTFTTTGAFNFYLEGSAPPYSGTFVQEGTATISVSVFIDRNLVSGGNTTHGPNTSVTVGPVDLGTPGSPPPQGPLVRFDICAPGPDSGTCSTTNGPGLPAVPAGNFGIPYKGSIGDEFMSHLLESDVSRTTPAIYFLQNARDSANGIFTPISSQFLQAQLFVSDVLEQTTSGTTSDNLILRKDL